MTRLYDLFVCMSDLDYMYGDCLTPENDSAMLIRSDKAIAIVY
jgi:hypothetical protein